MKTRLEKKKNPRNREKNDEDAYKKKKKYEIFVENDYPNTYSDEMNDNHINQRDNGEKVDTKSEKYSFHSNGKYGKEGNKD